MGAEIVKGTTENEREPQPAPVHPLMLNVAIAGDKVAIQVVSTFVISPAEARGLAAQLTEAARRAGSAIVIAGALPPELVVAR